MLLTFAMSGFHSTGSSQPGESQFAPSKLELSAKKVLFHLKDLSNIHGIHLARYLDLKLLQMAPEFIENCVVAL